MFNLYEVCEQLGVSTYTVKNWYRWENNLLKQGRITKRYLPQPKTKVHTKGSPRMWTDKMVEELKEFKSNIVTGRNGIYGEFSNPCHKQTKKYKKQMEAKTDEQ